MVKDNVLEKNIKELLNTGVYVPRSQNVLIAVIGSILLVLFTFGLNKLNNLELKMVEMNAAIIQLNKVVLKIDDLDSELTDHIYDDLRSWKKDSEHDH